MDTPEELPAAELPDQIRFLQAHAEELVREQNHEDAERIFEQILKAAPRNISALRYLAGRAIEKQDLDRARSLILRAIQIAPRRPELYQNLAIVLRAKGNLEEALSAYNTALGFNLQQPFCWIQRGDVLQALGRKEDAIACYFYAAKISGNLGLLWQSSQGNPRAQQVIQRAAKTLVGAREKAILEATRGILAETDRADVQRAITAGRHMARAIPPDFADPLQRPAFCFFPGLEPRPFYERSEFPFLDELEKGTKAIKSELEAVLSSGQELDPYVKIDAENPAQWKDLNHSPKWSSYHLYKDGERIDEHCAHCPETTRIVETLPLADITHQAPEVFFSILKPGTHIPPHYGIANYKLAVHLPLIVPDSCAIRVGDVTRGWKPGKCLVFDDSYEHEAWNHSDRIRAVLILEIWNPMITPVERRYLDNTIDALNRFERDMESLLAGSR